MALLNWTIQSKVLGGATRLSVILPFDGPDGKRLLEEVQKGKKLKTLYITHGGSDDCTTYYRNTGIERYANDYGLIVVMPEVRLSFYCDMYRGERYFTYLSKELPALIQSVLPASDKKEDHYVIGNSMGSHGSMKWLLRCPEFFNAGAGMSGTSGLKELGFYPRIESETWNPIKCSFGGPENYEGSENDLKALAKRLVESGKEIPRIFLCCGTEDFTYNGSSDFAEYAKEIGLPVTWKTGPGAHQWEFWDSWMKKIIDWMIRGGEQ